MVRATLHLASATTTIKTSSKPPSAFSHHHVCVNMDSTGNGHSTRILTARPMTEEPVSISQTATSRLLFNNPSPIYRRQTDAPHDIQVYVSEVPQTDRKWTQGDQDKTDEDARKKAMKELVQSWMDRLQLISVITTFFAAIEAQLLGITTPGSPNGDSIIDQVANASLAGALVVHVFAGEHYSHSNTPAFFLIRYKLKTAKREEAKIESGAAPKGDSMHSAGSGSDGTIWSSNPHIEQVGPFRRGQPPTHLLDHCHSLCMWLAAVGFVFALVGVLCFAWARLPFGCLGDITTTVALAYRTVVIAPHS
ncbi:hypothetical protein A0H81_10379 [Grifola frondosa]|uniref:Uncharacterized protein n=1 Tax=Grifola frondosa TaxID=5627 RepID=A0A1C7LYY0_GRIFR|nr:hypothetical protein A0H81_10379 [Grifola frondosa]